ncbi:MAG: hydrolase [Actinobacteria bacterium HGW-Actinobacteria-10]|jgi:dienelactone hydrolase|nr:MAG: hydrolase [Actinobacteria bacterium HGW-Actinobacteria-10]
MQVQSTAIRAEHADLPADLIVPDSALAVVAFAHGSGSSRLSPRNRSVAAALRSSGLFGTLLFDLLTPEEDERYANRFDIEVLSERLTTAIYWLGKQPETAGMPVGLFGASTGAAAALAAAADIGPRVRAVVSRGGRPDLAGEALSRVTAPTLLIVGALDTVVIDLNEAAFRSLASPVKRLELVPGATHLFEEPGTLEEVVALSLDWFEQHLA